jgi:hypothetical protein
MSVSALSVQWGKGTRQRVLCSVSEGVWGCCVTAGVHVRTRVQSGLVGAWCRGYDALEVLLMTTGDLLNAWSKGTHQRVHCSMS